MMRLMLLATRVPRGDLFVIFQTKNIKNKDMITAASGLHHRVDLFPLVTKEKLLNERTLLLIHRLERNIERRPSEMC